ncbi:MAG TPA: S8/S53 family peptidase, partial [Flavobacterium sp.]|nr:S8/S53 family peptidase [Flavobacterium sp.]
ATPIVASCATVLQSYYFSLTGNYLTSQQLRTIMQNTGFAQGTAVTGNIGPLPNMETAIQEVYDQSLGLNEETKFKFQVYPNPVSNQFTILSGELISNDAKVEVYTSLGQVVLTTNLPNDKVVDVSQLSNGFYFVKISENNRSFIQKIIKK